MADEEFDPTAGAPTGYENGGDADMDIFDADFDEATSWDDSPIPPGTYPATVINMEKGFTKAGNPKVVMTLALQSDDPNINGRWVSRHMPATGKGAGILKKTLQSFHADELPSGGFRGRLSDYNGQPCMVVIRQRSYVPEGETEAVKTHDVRAVKPWPGGPADTAHEQTQMGPPPSAGIAARL